MLRAKYIVFAFIGVMMGYVLYHNERFLVDPGHPAWPHYMTLGALLLHGVAGGAALFLAPLQFSDRLRKKHAKLHRVCGRIYVAGVAVLAPLGVYMQFMDEDLAGLSRSFTMAAAVDAMLLYVTTGIAFIFAVRRRINLHRQWMTRSYAVALVFFSTRFILGVTGLETRGPGVTETVVWINLAFAVLLGDIASQWQELSAAVSPPPATHASIEAGVDAASLTAR